MPTYEYECRRCGYHFEKFQGIKEKPLKRCPKCAGKISRLLGTGAGIIFKGSGFYQTDYRSKSYNEAVKKEKGESDSKPAKKDNVKTESSAPKQSGSTTKTQ